MQKSGTRRSPTAASACTSARGVAFVGGGMGRAITPTEKAAIKQRLEAAGFQNRCKAVITPVMMQETLDAAGICDYRLIGDGPGDSGCKCGLWVEIRKTAD